MRIRSLLALFSLASLAAPASAHAFCGFYVAKADTSLYNEASQVVIVRDGDRTVMTMSNDFQGEAKDFAMVIPVPTKIEKGQIHVAERKLMDRIDAYSSPRLVEYFDENPCYRYDDYMMEMSAAPDEDAGGADMSRAQRAKSLGVTIEAEYTVGEYDILILSAKQSDGLEKWLRQEGYKLPKGASKVLGSYIKQKMRFFVARVNLEEQSKLGFSYLRPIQVAYESPKFMLPIRLGTVNAKDTQELFVYTLTQNGAVETTNYRTVKLPTGMDLPLYVKDEFSDFYTAMFSNQVDKHNMKAVFVEYAWDMSWCDPCAADPLTTDELRELGVWWVGKGGNNSWGGGGQPVFLTRLHVRYDGDHFPEDLVFQTTGDRTNFQGRYVLRHPWDGSGDTCSEADDYFRGLEKRQDQEAKNLAELTGWTVASIKSKMGTVHRPGKKNWWEKLWE